MLISDSFPSFLPSVLNKVVSPDLQFSYFFVFFVLFFVFFVFRWTNPFPWVHLSYIFPTDPVQNQAFPTSIPLLQPWGEQWGCGGGVGGVSDFGVKISAADTGGLFLQTHPHPYACRPRDPCVNWLHVPVVTASILASLGLGLVCSRVFWWEINS